MTREDIINELIERLNIEHANSDVIKCFALFYLKINEIFDYFEKDKK